MKGCVLRTSYYFERLELMEEISQDRADRQQGGDTMKKKHKIDFDQLIEDWIAPLLIIAFVVGFVILVSK